MLNKIKENINNKEWIDNLFKLGFSGNEQIRDDSLSEIISKETTNIEIFEDNFKRLLNNVNNSEKKDLYNNTYRIANVIEDQLSRPNLQIVNIIISELENFPELKKLYIGIKSPYFSIKKYEELKKDKLTLKDIIYLDLILRQPDGSKIIKYDKNLLEDLNLFIKKNNFLDNITDQFIEECSKHINYQDVYLNQITNILLINNDDIPHYCEKIIPKLIQVIPDLGNNEREAHSLLTRDHDKVIQHGLKLIVENELKSDFHFNILFDQLEKKNITIETYSEMLIVQKYLLNNAIKMDDPENKNVKKQRL